MNEEYNIPAVLKQLRKTSGFSAKSVVKKLLAYGIDISDKTLYGYESGLSKLNADAFVALCDIYKCDNPLSVFKDTSPIDNYDFELLKKYHSIDSFGQETVNYILAREVKRVERTIISSTVNEPPEQYGDNITFIPELMQKICAGTGSIGDDVQFEEKAYPSIKVPSGAEYAACVSGESMEPKYSDGDIVFYKQVDTLVDGEIGIFNINNENYLKRYTKYGLEALNPEYGTIVPSEDDHIQVIGKVLGKL